MATESSACECHRCIREKRLSSMVFGAFLPLSATKLILECTNSNEPGQHGSVYEFV